jgi:hypothetical protein
MSSISAGTTTGTALVSTGDTTGNLDLKINGTTQAVRVNTSGAIGVGTSPAFGTSGQVLTSGGSSAAPSWTTISVPESNNDQVFTSSGTFTVPAGVSRVKVTVIGAAGNGGTGVDGGIRGGGGGAGGYVVDYVAVTAGGTATVTVGTNAGTRTSSFAGTTTITASGGSNGVDGASGGDTGLSAAASVFGVTFYEVGSARVDVGVYSGGGQITLSGVNDGQTGGVYAHGFGVGGSFNSGSARYIPQGYGAGGGGGGNSTGNTTGGTGANGLVIVEW